MPSWKVWPTPSSARYKLHLFVHELVGLPADAFRSRPEGGLVVAVEWKGNKPKSGFAVKGTTRNCTSKKPVQRTGIVSWEEGFDHLCKLKTTNSGSRSFGSWMVNLEVHALGIDSNGSSLVIGKTSVDVAIYVRDKGKSLRIPINCGINGSTVAAGLTVTVEFFQLKLKEKSAVPPIMRVLSSWRREFPRGRSHRPRVGVVDSGDDTNCSNFSSSQTTDADSDVETQCDHCRPEAKNKPSLLRFFSIGSKGMPRFRSDDRHWRGTPVVPGKPEDRRNGVCVSEDSRIQRSNSLRVLLHQEEISQASEYLELGTWEKRRVVSRDGRMELATEVFFASIDQCSEKAAGEGACAVIVAVIADWLHENRKTLPLRCQFDELIREGSSEWRKLCANGNHRERFLDRHFDLETVLDAKVRPISVSETDVRFFALERMPSGLDHLKETMSFDRKWEDLTRVDGWNHDEERTYITSWNDHFFILKVEREVIYLIDTLGERLYEGCNQAYILKFSKESLISGLEGRGGDVVKTGGEESNSVVLCEGIGCCKEFIEGFLAGLALRDLQGDIERGFTDSVNLFRPLQIEFHLTSPL